MSKPLLVTGAAGHLGRQVLELLLAANVGPVIATTRDPEKLRDFQARGVTVRAANFDAPESLPRAFAGAERMLLISTDDLTHPGRRLEQHRNAVAAAVTAGVKHVVYTSLTHPDASSPITFASDHRGTEEALANSPLGYSVLRNNLYADLLLYSLPRALASGQLVSAAGDGGVGFVTREDCARAAAAALTDGFEGRRVLDVTGPEVLTYPQVAHLASELLGRPLTAVSVPREALEAGLKQAGLAPTFAAALASIDAGIAQGKTALATDVVRQLTGQPAQDVRGFLTRHKAALLAGG
ncbi:NAD(P)-dependent oxidoreductase [Corallococcus sp. H22C18031201]|uniref:SDR family oxidoreductase n=1 Tax=Citreicoccus inhibens TaxID=2849499 RepID=UPI000E7135BD|nr:SDR family oxidoreductase [Citreicoccus inhibens]MBU8895187.1 SDR family oxidoreductase [Citreicoccus inhibens]RJS27323.1 NAD(P)-dependent oxidoreductase [Corallococcus sp. H22C18031201]